MVESRKNHKDWAKNIERLVRNPDLLKQLQINLYNTVKDKYDLNNVTNDRAKFYKEIIKKELN